MTDNPNIEGIPTTITHAMRLQLYLLGYKSIDIDKLTPQEAWTIINSKTLRSSQVQQSPASTPTTPKRNKVRYENINVPHIPEQPATPATSESAGPTQAELDAAVESTRNKPGNENLSNKKKKTQSQIRAEEKLARVNAVINQIDKTSFESLLQQYGIPADFDKKSVSSLKFKKDLGGLTELSGNIKGTGGKPDTEFSAILTNENKLLTDQGKILTSAEYKEKQLADRRKTRAAEREASLKQEEHILSKTSIGSLQQTQPKLYEILQKRGEEFVDPARAKIKKEETVGGTYRVHSTIKEENGLIRTAVAEVDKYGNEMNTLQKRFKSFGDQLKQNYSEVLRWTIAVSLLYAPLNKISQLMTNMITNQTRLAQTVVTLGAAQTSTNKIFEDAAQIAVETGTDIEGVLESYNQAFRATGNITDKTERYAAANKLLKDSIVLAKIAGIEQITAIDTLTAAQKQMGDSLTGDVSLLDKWVRVAKIANVDVNTLATSFAIVGEAAQAAGLSVDDLNGLVATLAEKGISSAKETGNAVRALVSGYQSDATVKELSRFGIAVKDVDGNVRGLKEVFGDIKNMTEQGLISETELSKIAYVIGGGNRRQAAGVMAITGLNRMTEISNTSAGTQAGEAAKALAILTDTVETKLVNLNTAFAKLAQTLGTEGGILDAIIAITGMSEQFVGVLTNITKILGMATPFLISGGILSLITKQGSPFNPVGVTRSAFQNIGKSPIGQAISETNLGATLQSLPAWLGNKGVDLSDTFKKGASFLKNNAASIGALIGTGFVAYMRASKGDIEGAASVAAGGILGGVISSFLGPQMIPLGVTLGTTIGEAFASQAEKVKIEIESKIGATNPDQPAYLPKATQVTENGKLVEDIRLTALMGNRYKEFTDLYKTLPQSSLKENTSEIFLSLQNKQIKQILDEYNKYLENPSNRTEMEKLFGGKTPVLDINKILKILSTTPTVGGKQNFQFGSFATQTENPIYTGARQYKSLMNMDESAELLQKLQKFQNLAPVSEETFNTLFGNVAKNETSKPITEYGKKENEFGTQARDIIKLLQEQNISEFKKQYLGGQLSLRSYTTQKLDTSVSEGKYQQLAYPMTLQGTPNKESLTKVQRILLGGTEEEQQSLIDYAATLKKMKDEIDTAVIGNVDKIQTGTMMNALGVEVPVIESLDVFKETYNKAATDYMELVNQILTDISRRTTVSPITDITGKDYTDKIVEDIINNAKLRIEAEAKAMEAAGKTDQANAYRAGNAGSSFWVRNENKFKYVEGISPDAFTASEKDLKEKSIINKGANIVEWDINASQRNEFQSIYDKLLGRFKEAGYTPNPESMVVYTKDKALLEFLFKDSIDRRLDAKVANVALKELNDKVQKQLDGMFNLPEGASFYVPYSAANMHRETKDNMPTDTIKEVIDNFAGLYKKFKEQEQEPLPKKDYTTSEDTYKAYKNFKESEQMFNTKKTLDLEHTYPQYYGPQKQQAQYDFSIPITNTISIQLNSQTIAQYLVSSVKKILFKDLGDYGNATGRVLQGGQ